MSRVDRIWGILSIASVAATSVALSGCPIARSVKPGVQHSAPTDQTGSPSSAVGDDDAGTEVPSDEPQTGLPGDATGGDATGGDATGGDATGGDATGGDATGGDATGGDATGGDATGGDATGGDGTDGSSAKGPGVRPAGNTGKGFFVSGRTIYDANGFPFQVRGINNNHWWGAEATDAWWTGDNKGSIPQLARTGANVARVVTGAGMGADTPAERRELVELYIKNGVVPMVEDHRATGKTSAADLLAVVDVWLDPANVSWLKEYEQYLMLNIANEWGPSSGSAADLALWRDTYITAIKRIRDAGINALIVVDAHQYGQRIEAVIEHGDEVTAADPQHNVLFSQHLYGYWFDAGTGQDNAWGDGTPYDMEIALTKLEATGLPIIIGEFAWENTAEVPYSTRTALKSFDEHGFGWVAWCFNLSAGHVYDLVKDYTYDSESDLTEYGQMIVNDPTYGLKATSSPASVF